MYMGLFRYEKEISVAVAPSRMFQAFVLDFHNLFPKLFPEIIKSIEIEHGDGGVGTIKVENFVEGSKHKYAKQRVDSIDKENLTCTFTVFEQDNMLDIMESIVYNIKFEPSGNGGSICKSCTEFHFTSDPGTQLAEELKNASEQELTFFKLVEAHLSANPDLYA
ncbi:major allergen Pru ar 1-like [Melia azedarach]|uniref:Major allergen Pru ar 1-like n=1 Tax=Melia azedarach TaxID=155640 RepID=A0ACC1YF96_MELAZ|nr:major allergen Pru ar 1-like [Melia azedarach]